MADDAATIAEKNLAVVKRYIEALIRGDQTSANQFLAPNLAHDLTRDGKAVDLQAKPPSQLAQNVKGSDLKILDLFASGNKVAARFSYKVQGDSVPGSRKGSVAEITGITIARVENEKIVEVWHEQNILSLLFSLGWSVAQAA